MKLRLFLAMAVLLGSLAGFLASQLVYHDVVSPIAASPDRKESSFSFLFNGRPPAHHVGKNHEKVKQPFRAVIAAANDSTVRLLVAGKQVALGVIIDSHGLILTKGSELRKPLRCAIPGGRIFDAKVVAKDNETDLALVQIEAPGLKVAKWSINEPTTGNWVAVPGGRGELPVVIGVVSAPAREIPQEKAILGVMLSESEEGPQINRVIQYSIASRIGLSEGDIITKINARRLQSSQQLVDYVSGLRPGAEITLNVVREGKSRSYSTRLGRFSELMSTDHEMEQELNRDLSVRRTGFPRVIQHDCILSAKQCGGSLVDLDGRIVGINIARAGRVSTYTLPTVKVKSIVARLKKNL